MLTKNTGICFSYVLAATALALLAGCAGASFGERYRPGDAEVAMWGTESIPIGPGWRFIGEEQATVRGRVRDTTLTTTDLMQTLVFVREGDGADSILLLSRVVKGADRELFVFLGGSKVELGGRPYRESLYYLSSSTADPEYRRYFAKAAGAGVALSPSYRVRVLDRLPVDTVLVRVMELTAGDGASQLPPFGRMYPQERHEPIIRAFR